MKEDKPELDNVRLLFGGCLGVYIAYNIGRAVVTMIFPSQLENVVVMESRREEISYPDFSGADLGMYHSIKVDKHYDCLDGKGLFLDIDINYLAKGEKLKNVTFRYAMFGCDHILDFEKE